MTPPNWYFWFYLRFFFSACCLVGSFHFCLVCRNRKLSPYVYESPPHPRQKQCRMTSSNPVVVNLIISRKPWPEMYRALSWLNLIKESKLLNSIFSSHKNFGSRFNCLEISHFLYSWTNSERKRQVSLLAFHSLDLTE